MTTIVLATAVLMDAAALLAEYEAGQWVPERAGRELAEVLAHGQRTGAFFHASLGDVPSDARLGRL
ncbi:hypothetical protein ACWDBD_41380 [Streptomyces sp. NPDC001118]